MKVIVLGDGLLGSEIINQSKWDYLSRKKDNVELCDTLKQEGSVVACVYSPKLRKKIDQLSTDGRKCFDLT